MLTLYFEPIESYDELNNEFITERAQTLQLEHSLVSLSKWESKWNKPFLDKEEKTIEETLDYIKCMIITQNVNNSILDRLTNSHMETIKNYIDSPMTATVIKQEKSTMNREIVTSEIIYYWMVAMNIPFECQKWHLNRLLTLINVCNIKNSPSKKMNKKELLRSNKELNEARKKSMQTTG